MRTSDIPYLLRISPAKSEDNAYGILFLFERKSAGFIYIFPKEKACRLPMGFIDSNLVLCEVADMLQIEALYFHFLVS